MSTKQEVLAALEKIPDDEPLFLVRGQDILSVQVVLQWIHSAMCAGVEGGKIQDAFLCAAAMAKWPSKKTPD